MHLLSPLGALIITLLASTTAVAGEALLSNGSSVDYGSPGSRVYVIQPNGARSPLWDGVHQLEDGSRLTVRNGMLSSSPWNPGGAVLPDDSCAQLVDRVCGKGAQCSSSEACGLARQLDDMYQQDENNSTDGRRADASQCAAALRDHGLFKPCTVD